MQLETERLLLRDFVEEDWEAVLAYQSDPLYMRYNPFDQRTEADAREFVGWFLAQQKESPRSKFHFAAILKSEGRLIGNCGIRVGDASNREADIGYEFDSRHWGRGIGTEAAREVVRYGFEELNLHRIWASCVEENIGSARVMEKVGMIQEGLFREKQFFKERWWNQRRFAILEQEWRAMRS